MGWAKGVGAVAEQPELGFAGLLRQLRAEAGLTQEALAEAAGVSPRSVSDLERGIHATAHKDTALLLAGALGLAGPARALFVAAARGHGPAAEHAGGPARRSGGSVPRRRSVALPRDVAAFTGRQAELGAADGDADRRGCGRRGGGHPRGGRDGRDRQDHLRGARRAPAGRELPGRAVLLAAARPHRGAAAGRPGRRAGQLAADRRGARRTDPARAGGAGGTVARSDGGQEDPAGAG